MDKKVDENHDKNTSKGRKKLRIIAVVIVLLVTICIGCIILVGVVESDPDFQATRTAREMERMVETEFAKFRLTESALPSGTPTITETPGPTDTPKPSNSPMPTLTNTLIPTSTPFPLIPPCAEMISNSQGMTEAQWDKYKEEHINGKWIVSWQGEIFDVVSSLGDYQVIVHYPDNCNAYFFTDEQSALSFSKGQTVVLTGQVDWSLKILNTLALYLVNSTVEIH